MVYFMFDYSYNVLLYFFFSLILVTNHYYLFFRNAFNDMKVSSWWQIRSLTFGSGGPVVIGLIGGPSGEVHFGSIGPFPPSFIPQIGGAEPI